MGLGDDLAGGQVPPLGQGQHREEHAVGFVQVVADAEYNEIIGAR